MTELCTLAIASEQKKLSPNFDLILKYIKPDVETFEKCCNMFDEPKKAISKAFSTIDKIVQSPDLCNYVIRKCPEMIKYVRDDLKTKELCKKACEKKWKSYEYISENYKSNVSFLPYRLYSCLT